MPTEKNVNYDGLYPLIYPLFGLLER